MTGRYLMRTDPSLKSLCPLTGGFDKTPISCDFLFLTYNPLLCIFNSFQSEFLVRQAKPERSSWLRSQPDKVSRPSEPSFASMRATVWVKRKQGDSRP
jgi:hypothetical protein